MPRPRITSSSIGFFCLQLLLSIATYLPRVNSLLCSDALLLAGYPSCINSCATICDKYCTDPTLNPSCTCTTPAYTREMFACIKKTCSSANIQMIASLASSACKAYGVDLATQLSSAITSPVTAGGAATNGEVTATATAAGVSNSSKKNQSGVPVSTVVGIVVGVVAGILIGAVAVYLCLRKRKAKATPTEKSQTDRSAATGVSVQPMDSVTKQGVIQWTPQSVSDIYPTAVNNPPPPPQYQTQMPSGPAYNSSVIKQPDTNGYYVSELPQPTTHFHAELPAAMETRAEMR